MAINNDVLGFGMHGYPLRNEQFLSAVNLYEAKYVIWSVPSILEELSKTNIDEGTVQLINYRLAELNKWVLDGNTLVLIAHGPLFLASVGQLWFQGFPPINNINFVHAHGARLEACGPTEVNAVLKSIIPTMSYDVLLSGHDFAPFLRVVQGSKGAHQYVGGFKRHGQGLIIYLPPIRWEKDPKLVEAAKSLSAVLQIEAPELPRWAHSYRTLTEKMAFEEIQRLQAAITEGEIRIAEQQAIVEEGNSLKMLFTGTGTGFARAVSRALVELGLDAIDGPHPRADILASNGTRYAAIEAKGVEGPCREAHLRETSSWMSDVNRVLSLLPEEWDKEQAAYGKLLQKLPMVSGGPEEDCKGILVVGTYRTTPIAERKEPDFPDAMQRKIAPADVCALTGLQLLNLVLEVRAKPELKDVVKKELFETKGILKRGSDWRLHLSQVS